MKLIVGLGNPGFKYRATRHNIGFMILDKIASRFGIRINNRLFSSLCGKGSIGESEVLLVKPLTYMNLAGKAVFEIVRKNDISLEDLLIIMDDVDLQLGRIRLRPGGSSGGHKGLRSIIEELETEDFSRLRVGIGPKEDQGFLSDYVLTPFKRAEKKRLGDSIERSCLCAEVWTREGTEPAMRSFNA
ncbi:aminoacyl-tRNA hydrolase [Omnitrophica bacterium]|nr:aminoacyl-tRNA hydrolase [Candidatus Omnitrophota bacterium]